MRGKNVEVRDTSWLVETTWRKCQHGDTAHLGPSRHQRARWDWQYLQTVAGRTV